MAYKLLADLVVVVHFLWIAFLAFGAVAGVRWKAARVLHQVGLAFALLIGLCGWYCPLTYVEIWLRHLDEPGLQYGESFIVRYLGRIVYPEIPAEVVVLLTILAILLNGIIYIRYIRARRSRGDAS